MSLYPSRTRETSMNTIRVVIVVFNLNFAFPSLSETPSICEVWFRTRLGIWWVSSSPTQDYWVCVIHNIDNLQLQVHWGCFPIPCLEEDVEYGVEKDTMTLFSAAEVLFKSNEDKICAQMNITLLIKAHELISVDSLLIKVGLIISNFWHSKPHKIPSNIGTSQKIFHIFKF